MVPREHHLRTMRVLWGAFFCSIALYAAVAWLQPAPPQPPDDRHTPLLWSLGLLATVNLLTVCPLYRRTLSRRRAAPEDAAGATLRAHRVACIVAMAQVESVAILGLVLYLVAGRLDWFSAFAAAALIGMLVLYPRRAELDQLLASAVSTGGPPPIDPT